MSLLINFFGGPGIGKSTQAADLFTMMKKNNLDVELTFEFPKLLAWDKNIEALKDQFFVTANQHRNISRLYGQVDYIIIDSPILLGTIYKKKYDINNEYSDNFYGEEFDNFIISLFKKYNSLNIFLEREEKSFNQLGRIQSYDESIIIDEEIKNKLRINDIPFMTFPVDNNTSYKIYETMKMNRYIGD